jgi:DNA-binding XRE family transcriptional regulator
LQREGAAEIGVNTWTYILWEHDTSQPTIRHYPGIFGFLGYNPFPAPRTLPERIAAKRRQLGLSFKQVADLLGVDEGSVAHWESGEWKPRMSATEVRKFLTLPDTSP